MSVREYFEFDNSNITDLFKTVYRDFLNNRFSEQYPLISMIRRDKGMVGNRQAHDVKRADTGGFRAGGGMPEASDTEHEQTNYSAIQLLVKGRIDPKAIALSAGKEGAFEKILDSAMLDLRKMFHRNMARMLMGDKTAALGTIAAGGVTDNGNGNYSVVISAATYIRHRFRRGEMLNVGTDTSSVFRVMSVSMNSDRVVVIERKSGAVVPVATDILYRQGSKDNEWVGLTEVLPATSGSQYGVVVGDGWQSVQKDADEAPFSIKMLQEVMGRIREECGETPKVIVCNQVQETKITQSGEDLKIMSMKEAKGSEGNILGNKPHFFIAGVEMPLIVDDLCPPGVVMLLNPDRILWESVGEGRFIPGTDGFLHYKGAAGNEHMYEIFFEMLGNFFIDPKAQGYIYNLSVNL